MASLLFILILLIFFSSNNGNYILKFKEGHFPPKDIPSDPMDLYYSAPLKQTISKAIIAYITYMNGTLYKPIPTLNITATVTSLDVKTAKDKSVPDMWVQSGGKLCQKSAWWLGYPERINREYAKTRCGSPKSTVQLNVEIFQGEIIIDWIYHEHSKLPSGHRILRIEVPNYHVMIDTYPIRITTPAHHLSITKQPPASINANHNFNVEVEIRDKSNKPVVEGLDSVAYVILTVPYDYKLFYVNREREMMLARTIVRLDGDEFSLNLNTRDRLVRKQTKKGKVLFKNIRILETAINFQLNITMTMARDPYSRIPPCPACYMDVNDYRISEDGNVLLYNRLTGAKHTNILSIVFTSSMNILPQRLSKLELVAGVEESWNKMRDTKTKRIPILINFYIPGGFSLTALDSSGRRIYSGPDSEQKLVYVTEPTGICISYDFSNTIKEGIAIIYLSICQIVDKVQLVIYPEGNKNASYTTPEFSVRGNVSIAHFGDLYYSGSGENVDCHINTFIQFAVNDINNGVIVPVLKKKGIWLSVKSVDTKNKISIAYKNLMNITSHSNLLHYDSVRLVISSVSAAITRALNPLLLKAHLPFISTANNEPEFSDNTNYPYFNRVCWTEDALIQSVLLASKERNWLTIVILRYLKNKVNPLYYVYMRTFGITLAAEVILPDLKMNFGKVLSIPHYTDQMKHVKSVGSRIIFFFAPKHIQPHVFREAYDHGISSLTGYQWVLVGKEAFQFPFDNDGVCKYPVKCTIAFAGTCLFSEQYNISGYSSPQWIRVFGKWFAADRTVYKGGSVSYRPNYIGAKLGLGYDAVHLYAETLATIIERRLTVTGRLISEHLRHVNIDGLTSEVSLDEQGNRIGYFGTMAQINPRTHRTSVGSDRVIEFTRLFSRINDSVQLEIPFSADEDFQQNFGDAPVILPNSTRYNLRHYWSYSGMIDIETQKLVRNPREKWPSVKVMRTEQVVAPFFCDHPCGNKLIRPEDITAYDTGTCVRTNICQCKIGYKGNNCQHMECNCRHGHCNVPETCVCYKGYRGADCSEAVCTKCSYGKCIKPQVCECHSWRYMGAHCNIYVGLIILLSVVVLLLLSVFTYFLIVYTTKLIQHSQKLAALVNTDWIVDWTLISIVDIPKRKVRISFSNIYKLPYQKFKWKQQYWHASFINSKTLDGKSEALILEMVNLVKLRHINITQFGGACLVNPKVSLLVEFYDKGSLEDILANETVDLGWEFRFSFLKDICRGMEFIHDTSGIKSHGRLKSSNCLIDNRWTVRLSGFGAHIIRFGEYRIPNVKTPEEMVELFWTAPELLRNVSNLDGVKAGTPLGDVYSFAIVACEIITREAPYNHELSYLSVTAILDLIRNDCSKSIQQIWEEIGGKDMLYTRPIIEEEYFSISRLSRILFRRLLDHCWSEKPSARPGFSNIAALLNKIHPTKGELIDNLIILLERYSSNLEVVVFERTKELEKSKARAEQLLSQMLPLKVAIEIKQGNKILPEYFDCVTVFFSDIANFSMICKDSNAFEIVDFLNETYYAFDTVLDDYDVYKVETISDSYMVVSGLPEKNDNRHAGEIATMALDLMSIVTLFQIPHMPKSILQLRIGMHSGPVVSGVVGKLMPRYCLFGDTVNTASRMESSSYALHIQVSETTAAILEELGGYSLESRGQRDVKGRGKMTTYWLWGKDTFRKMLPDQSLALSLSQHKFK